MALRAVPDHPKFADLKHRLVATKGAALGYLECIWHFSARFTPRGNIGKYSDSAIEAWVEWDGEPGLLISAMVESCWLHLNGEHRVVVHDWSQHADETVQTTLARNCETFWDGSLPKAGRLNQHERERFKRWVEESASSQPAVSQHSASLPEASAIVPKPVPVPVPVPVPEPVPVAKRHAPPITIRREVPENMHPRIHALASQAPDPQYFETGINRAAEEIASSGNPEITLAAMEENLPVWWTAMLDGRAKMRPMLYLISDRDYLRRPREPTNLNRQTVKPSVAEQRKSVLDRVL